MNAGRRLLAPSLLLVCLAVTACGSDAPEAADSTATPGASTASPSTTGVPDGSAIASVSLQRSGGLRPTTVHRTFSVDGRPPRGFTPAEVDAALAAAQRFAASDASLAPVPSAACCDLYTYIVTITHADGTSSSYQTVDGLAQPRVFDDLLGALA